MNRVEVSELFFRKHVRMYSLSEFIGTMVSMEHIATTYTTLCRMLDVLQEIRWFEISEKEW